MDGFGKVEPEANEPVFDAPWEGRVMAMMRAMGAAGAFNLDMFRDAREHQPADFYLTASYYKSWERCIETLAMRHGLVAPDELGAGRSRYPAKPSRRGPLRKQDVPNALKRGSFGRPPRGAGAVQNRRPRAGEEHAPDYPHAFAALLPRTIGRDRANARQSGISGQLRARPR